MTWWIALGAVGFGLVLLVLAVLSVLRRLAGLGRATRRVRWRAAQLQELQSSADALRERLAEVAARTGEMTFRNDRARATAARRQRPGDGQRQAATGEAGAGAGGAGSTRST
jgi:hypothetical protein